MPPILRRRGRPKGHELTVIGLPMKKKKKESKLLPFIKLHTSIKEKGMDGGTPLIQDTIQKTSLLRTHFHSANTF